MNVEDEEKVIFLKLVEENSPMISKIIQCDKLCRKNQVKSAACENIF